MIKIQIFKTPLFGGKPNIFQKASSIVDGNGNLVLQNSTLNINSEFENILELGRSGNHEEVQKKLECLSRGIAGQHPLYPHWQYNLVMNQGVCSIEHVPSSQEAFERYPLHGCIKFLIPEEYKWAKNWDELAQYGYETQSDIEVNVLNIKTWIGDYLIDEASSREDRSIKLKIVPPKFPEPVPVKLFFEDNSFSIDYLEIGLEKIERNRFILSNFKQSESKLFIRLSINLNNTNDCKIDISINEKFLHNVKANLMLKEFLLKSQQKTLLKLTMLKQDKDLLVADSLSFSSEPELDKVVKLLTQLYEIEKYYGVSFHLPKRNIREEELEAINLLSLSMKGSPRKGKYEHVSLKIVVNKTSDQYHAFKSFDVAKLSVTSINRNISLFEQDISFNEMQVDFFNATIKNKAKLLKKLQLADNDEVINIEIIPAQGKNNICKEYYKY